MKKGKLKLRFVEVIGEAGADQVFRGDFYFRYNGRLFVAGGFNCQFLANMPLPDVIKSLRETADQIENWFNKGN